MNAREFWKERFGEYPQTDADRLAVAMMAEYADSIVRSPDVSYDELITFAMYLCGHNREDIEQMYKDWKG